MKTSEQLKWYKIALEDHRRLYLPAKITATPSESMRVSVTCQGFWEYFYYISNQRFNIHNFPVLFELNRKCKLKYFKDMEDDFEIPITLKIHILELAIKVCEDELNQGVFNKFYNKIKNYIVSKL